MSRLQKKWNDFSSGGRLEQSQINGTLFTTTSASYQTARTFTTSTLPIGTYRLDWCIYWSRDLPLLGTNAAFLRVTVDGVTIAEIDDIPSSSANNLCWTGFAFYVGATAATHTILVQVRGNGAGLDMKCNSSILHTYRTA